MTLKLFNTLTKKKKPFTPLKSPQVGLYTCGPTVYHYAHIGNLRSYIFEDILKRTLLLNNLKVNHVMNITDVGHLTSDSDEGEDKMSKGLRREGLPFSLEGVRQLAEKYTKAFQKDLHKLNIIPPNVMPKATEHIKEDIEIIQKLEENGFTYKTSDGIYFDTAKLDDYGKLVGHKQELNEEHARIAENPEKRQPQDFALWKFNETMGWDTPWGKGFPGWHIECSAMASRYLGEQFDIHCGGIDHIPVHHTNEIAQSEAAFGKKPWVTFWLHNEYLVLKQGEKMAKSGENFVTLKTLEEKGFDPLDYRYFCLGTHYRNPLMFSIEALESARVARKKLVEKAIELRQSAHGNDSPKREEYALEFKDAVNDDLNTSKALAVMWEMLKDNELQDHDKWLLLLEFDRIFGFNLGEVQAQEAPKEVIELAKQRLKAREEKNWTKSDELREKIRELGWEVGDTKDGFELKKK